jgi:uncharacterized protein (DUF1800 family)
MASLAPLQGTLGTYRAAHLLRRASYRFTKAKVDQLANLTAANAVAALLVPDTPYLTQPIFDDAASPANEAATWINPPGTADPAEDFVLRRWVMTWWLSEALEDASLHSKMTFFMHQYNVVTANSYGNEHFFDYLALLRWGALGNWKKLATKIVTDNCMLRYLNNNTNSANNPNENFAREFFELFTIGKGEQAGDGDYTTYTEADIVQAAKVLTGHRTQGDRTLADPETGIPRGRVSTTQHNWTEKVFSPRLQNLTIAAVPSGQRTEAKMREELGTMVNRIFDQDATARNFCRRLYRFFVGEKITAEIETDIIAPLATAFKNGNYEIAPIVATLLSSQHFYGEDNTTSVENTVGGMLKSPLEMTMQAITFFGITLPDGTTDTLNRFRFFSQGMIDRMLLLSGMPVFQSSDVAGYPAYHQMPDFSHQWFTSSTIIGRYKLPTILLSGRFSIGSNPNGNLQAKLDIVSWVKNSGFFSAPSDPYVLVQELTTYLLPKYLDNDRFNYFYQDIFLDNLPPNDWTYEWDNYLATNNATEVKIPLERLVHALLYSQEYQTF